MIGTFERNIGGVFVYRTDHGYVFFKAQGMVPLFEMPRSFNIWQNVGQLKLWIMSRTSERVLAAGERYD